MLGRTMAEVLGGEGDREMIFRGEDGSSWRFYHEQDCCESVTVEDITGDISDLLGSPVTMAEEVSGECPAVSRADSYTWTFYKFGTAKGFVTVRWLGESNGYYSESVDFSERIMLPLP